MTRGNAVRKEVYNKDKKTIDELVRYWNEEKQEFLYVSPWGKHFRCGSGCDIYDHMEVVTLQDMSFLYIMLPRLNDNSQFVNVVVTIATFTTKK